MTTFLTFGMTYDSSLMSVYRTSSSGTPSMNYLAWKFARESTMLTLNWTLRAIYFENVTNDRQLPVR
jgi:hypothetical protein